MRQLKPRQLYFLALLLVAAINVFSQQQPAEFSAAGFHQLTQPSGREVFGFNNGWYFIKGDVKNAESINFKLGNNWRHFEGKTKKNNTICWC